MIFRTTRCRRSCLRANPTWAKARIINKLLNRKNFARVSAQPGKTIHINYFTIDKAMYLVDLPGYGYARVSKAEQQRWGALMETYFAMDLLTLGIQIVDIRHKPTRDDMTMGGVVPRIRKTVGDYR